MSVTVAMALTVALRKESVDRNAIAVGFLDDLTESLSARRAWIEIAARMLYQPAY